MTRHKGKTHATTWLVSFTSYVTDLVSEENVEGESEGDDEEEENW